MSDTTIPALLEELREVDADTYREIQKRLLHYMIAPQMDAPIVLDHIQGCIQRAIAEKGWSYQQILYQNPTIYEAYLIGHRETIRRASTPSAAILAAYIEAKRATR